MKRLACFFLILFYHSAVRAETFEQCAQKFLGTYSGGKALFFLTYSKSTNCVDCLSLTTVEGINNAQTKDGFCAKRHFDIINKNKDDMVDLKFICNGHEMFIKHFYDYTGKEFVNGPTDGGWGYVQKVVFTETFRLEGKGEKGTQMKMCNSGVISYNMEKTKALMPNFNPDKIPPKSYKIKDNLLSFPYNAVNHEFVKTSTDTREIDDKTWKAFRDNHCPKQDKL